MDKREKRRLKLRLEALKNISEGYSMGKCLEDLKEATEMLDGGEHDEVLEKIEDIEKRVQEKVEKEKNKNLNKKGGVR